jgi:hypothetical protein
MAVGGRGVFVALLTVFVSRSCVRFRLFVLAHFMMVGCLLMMVGSGVVMSRR